MFRLRLRRFVPGLRHDGHSLCESLIYSHIHSCASRRTHIRTRASTRVGRRPARVNAERVVHGQRAARHEKRARLRGADARGAASQPRAASAPDLAKVVLARRAARVGEKVEADRALGLKNQVLHSRLHLLPRLKAERVQRYTHCLSFL